MSADDSNLDYYSRPRVGLLDLVTAVPARVLDVGCGAGATLALLAERGATTRYGIERNPTAAATARGVATEVWVGDVEQLEPPLADGTVDLIVYGDVLEHLVDPWRLLRRFRRLLAPGGRAVTSVPNIAHYEVLRDLLLHDEFRYRDDGILDRTHLRFFTHRTLRRMLEESGYRVVDERPFLSRRGLRRSRWTLHLLRRLFIKQWYVLFEPVGY